MFEARRSYRELIATTPGLAECISAAILYDETIRQQTKDGTPLVKVIIDAGIIPGIKVDTGAKDMGGQSVKLASARLNAMNVRFKSRLPWALAFSFARAIQQPAMEIWSGQDVNVKTAQQALLHRARCNRAARRGEYADALEKP